MAKYTCKHNFKKNVVVDAASKKVHDRWFAQEMLQRAIDNGDETLENYWRQKLDNM